MISPEKAENIRKLYADGMPKKQIARRLKMDVRQITRLVRGMPNPHADDMDDVVKAHLIRIHRLKYIRTDAFI